MAALDTLALGPYIFTDFAVPDALPIGGKQTIKVHKLSGGDRTLDTMGPDDDDRQFEFLIVGADAVDQVLLLSAMKDSGSVYPYSNGVEARLVVIASFTAHFQKLNVAHCSICLTPADNPNGTSAGAGAMTSDQSASSDLGSASTTASTNATSQAPAAGGSGGIGSDYAASSQGNATGGIGHQ